MEDRTALHAFLANLAYVSWEPGDIGRFERLLEAAETARIAPANATQRLLAGDDVPPWTLVHYTEDPISGFAAAILAQGHHKVLTLRGTELAPDTRALDLLQTDLIEIGLVGCALSQATALFNYMQRLHAPAGATDVLRLELHVTREPPATGVPVVHSTLARQTLEGEVVQPVHYWFEAHRDGLGLGVIEAGDELFATGHSLGGHLAALALRLFPTWLAGADTFNAAHFDPVLTSFLPDRVLALLQQATPDSPLAPFVAEGFANPQRLTESLVSTLFAPWLPSPPAPSFDALAGRLQHWVGEDSRPGDDFDLVSSWLSGRAPGPERTLPTETNSHSMDPLVDSLAVLDVFRRLAPTLPEAALADLLAAASNRAENSLECLVEALGRRLLGETPDLPRLAADFAGYPVLADGQSTIEIRAALYAALTEVDATISWEAPPALALLIDVPVDELVARAHESAAVRAALLLADPFAMTGELPRAYATQITDDAAWHADAYRDRAEWLVARTTRNLDDGGTWQLGEVAALFVDRGRDERLQVLAFDGSSPRFPNAPTVARIFGSDAADTVVSAAVRNHFYGAAGDDVLTGDRGSDVLDGGAGLDSLTGGAGDDRLFGGPGDDILWSARAGSSAGFPDSGRDLLVGGTGFDRLHAGSGDHVRDADGALWVVWRSSEFAASERSLVLAHDMPGLQCFRSPRDWMLFYTYLPERHTLIVNGTVVEDFQPGELGITLPTSRAPEPARSAIVGTANVDRLVGTAAHEAFAGYEGADAIDAWDGDDEAQGGPGNDRLNGGEGDDRLRGELDSDALFGLGGDDLLQGGPGMDVLTGDDGIDIVEGGDGEDFVCGGDGVDVLHGGEGGDFLSATGIVGMASDGWHFRLAPVPRPGHDVLDPRAVETSGIWVYQQFEFRTPTDDEGDLLFGEGGNDHLLGSAGHDWLEGGAGNDIIAGADGNDDLLGGDGADHLRGGGGADLILGEAGDDVIAGHGGDESYYEDTVDTLDGGEGNDRLHGGAAADLLEGGAGNDTLFGDEGDDTLQGSAGRDRLEGNAGNDSLHGGAAADQLAGGAGDDVLEGGDDTDTLDGGDGRDTLLAGAGSDLLIGGSGDDLYRVGSGAGAVVIRDTGGRNVLHLPDLDTLTRLAMRFEAGDLLLSVGTPALAKAAADTGAMVDTGTSLRVIGGEAGVLDAVRFGDRGYLPFTHLGDWDEAGIVAVHENATGAVGSAGHDRILLTAAGAPDAGAGDDRYEWVAEIAGTLRLSDVAGDNRLELPWRGGLAPRLEGALMVLTDPVGGARVELSGFDPSALRSGPRPVGEVHFADGSLQTWDQLVDAVNTRPRCAGALPLFEVPCGTGRTLALPVGLLSDPDPGDTLTLALVSPAPAWVRVAADASTLTASPAAHVAGLYSFTLRARDPHGDSVDLDVEIRVLPATRAAATALADGLTGTAAANVLRGLGGADSIRGLGGADRLEGQLGNDYLRGDAGMDLLLGGVGDDWLDGGTGADRLLGGTGNDSYFFGPGSGRDTVVERAGEGQDCVRLAPGVMPDQLLFTREAGGWALGLGQTSDRLLLGGPLDAPLPVELLRFADGSRVALADLVSAASTLAGDGAVMGGAGFPVTSLASLMETMDAAAPFMSGAEIRAA